MPEDTADDSWQTLKFFLIIYQVCFNTVFLIQRYILYRAEILLNYHCQKSIPSAVQAYLYPQKM